MKNISRRSLVLLTLLLMILTSTIIYAASFPPKPTFNIFVQDYADIIYPDTEETIQSLASELELKTTAQVVTVTVPSLNGMSIEEYAYKLFEYWGIGVSGKDNGVLFLVAPDERELRIEVGYGLEEALTDSTAGKILDEVIGYFAEGDYDNGILYGVERITSYVAKASGAIFDIGGTQTPSYVRISSPSRSPSSTSPPSSNSGRAAFILLFVAFILTVMVLIAVSFVRRVHTYSYVGTTYILPRRRRRFRHRPPVPPVHPAPPIPPRPVTPPPPPAPPVTPRPPLHPRPPVTPRPPVEPRPPVGPKPPASPPRSSGFSRPSGFSGGSRSSGRSSRPSSFGGGRSGGGGASKRW